MRGKGMDFELQEAFEFSDQEPDLGDESLGVPKILVIGWPLP
jgi:hypothetical protein